MQHSLCVPVQSADIQEKLEYLLSAPKNSKIKLHATKIQWYMVNIPNIPKGKNEEIESNRTETKL